MSPEHALCTARTLASAVVGGGLFMVGHDLVESSQDFEADDYVRGGIWLTVVLVGWVLAELMVRNNREIRGLRTAADSRLSKLTPENVAAHITRQLAEDRPDAEVVNLRG